MVGAFLAVMESPESVGKVFGGGFWIILMISGVAKCIGIARRETASAICVSSLALALVAFIGSSLLSIFKEILPAPFNTVSIVLFAFVAVVSAVVGLTLGIVGLCAYGNGYTRDGKHLKYQQGRRQAGWGIGLNLLFMSLIIIGIVSAVVARSAATQTMKQVRNHNSGKYVFEEKNFRLTVDGNRWIQMDASAIMKDSTLVLRQVNPEVYVAVIAEQIGVEHGFTTERLVEVAQAHLKSGCPDALVHDSVLEVHKGLLGTRFSADAKIGQTKLVYDYWCSAENGYSYQIICWAKQDYRDQMAKQVDEVLDGFELIDPQRRYFSSSSGPFDEYMSDLFGYTVDLQKTDWCNWANLAETDTLPEVGGRHPKDVWFTVTPVVLPIPDVSLDHVRKAFFNLYEITDNKISKQEEPVVTGGLEGCGYSLAIDDYQYAEQLLMSSNCAYLVSVWCTNDDGDELGWLSKTVFDGLSFSMGGIDVDAIGNLPEERLETQARLVNQIGLAYYRDSRFADSLEWFKAAHGYGPADCDYFGNILAAYYQLGQYQDGLDFLGSTGTAGPAKTDTIRSWEASMLLGAGRFEEADAAYEALFKSGYRSDTDFKRWTNMRTDQGNWADLDRIVGDYMGKEPSVELRIHLMDLYWKKGDYRKVADLAEQSQQEQGFSPDIAYWAIDAYQELGLNREALDVCCELIEKGFTTVNTYQEKATSEYRLKWHRQAKESLEKALKLNPNNQDTKDWLQLVSAELGEGDNSILKNAIDPVLPPDDLENQLLTDAPDGFGNDFGAYYERKLVLWEYRKGERLRRTDVQRIKLLDDAGVSAFSSLEYSFNPVSQDIFVNKLLVRNEKGEVVSRGVVKDYYVTDDTSDGLVSEDKRLVIPVSGLQPGYSVDVMITRDYPSGPDKFYFECQYLAAGFPVLNAAVYLAGTDSDVASVCLNGVEPFLLGDGTLWMRKKPYAYRWEPLQIYAERFVPVVVLGCPEGTWEECGSVYLEKIRERLGTSVSLKKKVDELTADCASDEAKYKAIVDWIRTAFTYKPLEFGRSAFMPDCASDTLSYRYGDCKDLSVLLMEMLAAAEIPSSLALVNSSSDVYPDIPTTDQFNHVIVYLPGVCEGLFVDPTDQEADAFLAVPMGLQKCRALVLDPADTRLETIGSYPPDSSSCSIHRSIEVDGDLIGLTDRISLKGYYAAWMRAVLKEQKKINWVEWYQNNLVDFVQGLQVEAVTATHVSDNDADLELEVSYTLRHAVRNDGDRVSVKVPSIWIGYYLSAKPAADRKNPFRISYPLVIDLTTTVRVPEGYGVDETVGEVASGNTQFMDWETNVIKADSRRFHCSLKHGEFPAGEYGDYVAATDAAIKASMLEWRIIKTTDAEASVAMTVNQ